MKKTKTKFILALLVLIGTIISTIPGWIEIYQTATGNMADLDEYLATYREGNLPEGYYNVTLDASLGNFASHTYEDSSYKDSYYYIAWLNDDSFIAMSVNEENQGIMDSLTQNTWDLLDGSISYDEFAQGEKFTFLGNISPMDSEEERFYRSTLAEFGIDDYDYNIRYQSLSVAPSDYIFQMINVKFNNIQLLLILVSGCVVIVNGLRLHKDRKQMKSIESSVQDYDPTNVVKRQKVVTGKEAMARISNPYLQKYLKDKKQLTIIGCTIVALCVIIPSGLYAYMKFATPSKSASRVYVMDNSDDYSSVKKKAVGEITISYTPVLVYTPNKSSMGDYIIYPENSEEIFIVELEDDEFIKAVDEIRGTGSTTLHGYYRSVPEKARENFVEFYNYYGGNYDTDDFNRLFGPYCLVVDDNYNGVGIVMDDISTIGAIEIFIMVIALLILFDGVPSLISFKSEMRYLTDGEYDRFESDFASPQTKEITKFFYCTDKYILALDTFTRLISYSDILWAYLTIHTQNGKEVRYEIKILDRRKGFFELPSIAAGASNKETINMVLNIIANKNPNARIGYTQENIQAAEQINRQ